LYVASVKKHLQNLHPEIFANGKEEVNLENYWRLEKIDIQKIDGVEKAMDKPRKLKNTSQTKKESKEENKVVTKNEVKEDIIKAQDRLLSNQVVNPCYQQLQSDMFPLAYRPPFLYPQQNYDFFYMLQPVNQNTSVNQPNLWMHKVPDPVSQQVIDPMVLSKTSCHPSVKLPHHESNFGPPNDLMTRIKNLPTLPVAPINKRDHPHVHNEFCGHATIKHDGHIDYIHEAELHFVNSAGSFLLIK